MQYCVLCIWNLRWSFMSLCSNFQVLTFYEFFVDYFQRKIFKRCLNLILTTFHPRWTQRWLSCLALISGNVLKWQDKFVSSFDLLKKPHDGHFLPPPRPDALGPRFLVRDRSSGHAKQPVSCLDACDLRRYWSSALFRSYACICQPFITYDHGTTLLSPDTAQMGNILGFCTAQQLVIATECQFPFEKQKMRGKYNCGAGAGAPNFIMPSLRAQDRTDKHWFYG